MKHKLVVFLLTCTSFFLIGSVVGFGAVLNVEFKFTPFTGDLKNSEVEAVPGEARIFINNVPYAEQQVGQKKLPVLFESRDAGPAVWVPMESSGPVLRKGRNKIRIEFTPTNPALNYQTQVSWATVNDSATTTSEGPGKGSATNESGTGVENKPAKGKMVFEREFTADFAADLPWHHYAPVTSLTDQDKQALSAAMTDRVSLFKPAFDAAYKMLGAGPMHVDEARKLQCLEKAYAAGVRVTGLPLAKLDYVLTGNPEVVIRGKDGGEVFAIDSKPFEKIKGEDAQFCAEMAVRILFPVKLVFVRTPAGSWQLAY